MKVVLFCHSLASDWNHGNAHFLRGVARELLARGHEVSSFEPHDGWSRTNLVDAHGQAAVDEYERAFPELAPLSTLYDLDTLDLAAALDCADFVLVHEWNDPTLVRRVGRARADGSFRLLFHDTHHRAATRPEEMARYDLSEYDGVLAFGAAVRDLYLEHGWTQRAWAWHEAADTRLFHQGVAEERDGDLVWIGNWGDGERTRELEELLFEPVRRLALTGSVHGVRYPPNGRAAVAAAGLAYGGWVPNHRVPEIFARHAVTVHVPRRPYAEALPGIPTIRVFEALACGIPLVTTPWDDAEGLFEQGEDFLSARNADEMERQLARVLRDRELAQHLSEHGLRTIQARHTCAQRVDELLAIVGALAPAGVAA